MGLIPLDTLYRVLSVLSEDEDPVTPASPEQTAAETTALDAAAQDEIRSATHAVLGRTIGTKIYDSKFVQELAGMAKREAEVHNASPQDVLNVMKSTLSSWRYVSKVALENGAVVNVAVRIEVGEASEET